MGKKIVQETRGYDANRGITVSQREKESAHDYRYFPEPDIPPLEFSEDYIEHLRHELPELPHDKAKRVGHEYKLPEADVDIIISDKHLADYFEDVVSELREKIENGEFACDENKAIKLAANYIITELRKHVAEHEHNISEIKITPEDYAELICFVASDKINSSAAQTVLAEMYKTGANPAHIISDKNLVQVSDTVEIGESVNIVISENNKSVQDYKAGKENALKFLVGQVMKKTRGKANPQIVQNILKDKLR